jgi:hypothetical protein
VDFGNRVSTHRGTISAGGWAWYIGLVLVAAGVFGVGKTAFSLITGAPGVDSALASVAGLVIGPLILILPVLRWRQTVEVFERGLVWTRLYGTVTVPREKVRAARWIQHRSRNGSHDEIEIDLVDGGLSIVGIDQPEQLRNFVSSWAQAPVMMQQAQGAWAQPQQQPQSPWGPGGWRPPGS